MINTVSIIIPAFNAANWVRSTVTSACAQSHRDLQVIVVDDGSQDETAAIVADMARGDSRIMLIRQPNGGVARARNAGIDAAVGAFIAPLDADDLWAPRKIELQVAALARAPAGSALAYNWYRRIDAADRILPVSPYPLVEGTVFHRHLEWNFISNGSTPLVRADVARAVRYDPALRDAGREGTEDYLFQLQVARAYGFVCVPAFLTGYRTLPASMGANPLRMAQSHLAMFAIIARDASPEARRIIARRQAEYRLTVARLLARARDPRAAAYLAGAALARPQLLWKSALRRSRTTAPLAATLDAGMRFDDCDITVRDGNWATRRPPALLARLAELDARPA
ncbi:glycosyltransferase family 2 protein [Sphingomonas turrisvirgatae]|uniref:Glycosyltransferase 2-like domain-containing protein n=1 Tax=Sphingomonas turrisvirgatae TaxID=1888892 RepID=A0A1E3LRV3_9SPHN|nr:glycosyltransferase family 2 protein [Sphingomonas turrisvirgatae]ODP36492.1 hypothetical protein BFL28_05760 [Sphingomonas turrisvirgatae]